MTKKLLILFRHQFEDCPNQRARKINQRQRLETCWPVVLLYSKRYGDGYGCNQEQPFASYSPRRRERPLFDRNGKGSGD